MTVIRPNAEPAVTAPSAGDIFLIDGSTGVRALAATSVPILDASGNTAINNLITGFASTPTAAGTTTLTVASAAVQYLTGTTTQTVVLPVVSTLQLNQTFTLENASTGVLTVNSSGGILVSAIGPGATVAFKCVAITGTSAASWSTKFDAVLAASGKVLTVSNSLTLAGTDGTTQTFPTTSATLARTDAGQTFTGTNAFGVLTATSFNGNTLTAGSWGINGNAGKGLTFNNSLVLAGTDGTTLTFQGTDTYVSRTSIDTLTNKTLTAPVVTGGTAVALTGLAIRSTASAFDLTFANSEVLTAGRSLNIAVNDASRAINLHGNLNLGGDFTVSGAFATVLTATAATSVTLPIAGTLSTLVGVETLSNKTMVAPALGAATATSINGNTWTAGTGVLTIAAAKTLTVSNSLTLAGIDGTTMTFPGTSDTVVTLAAAQTLTNKTLTAPTINGSALSGTFSGTPTLSGANFITRANLAQVAASSLSGNPTGALANESAITLGLTLNFSGTTLNATTATGTQLGAVKPDGTTITITGGVLTAVGAAATSIGVGTTTIGSGTSGSLLYDNAGTLGNQTIVSALGTRATLPTISTALNTGATTGTGGFVSGTYTTPAGVLWLEIELVGGGGGASGSGTSPGSGGTGGNTTFGTSLLTANGGGPGLSTAAPGGGGTASGGYWNPSGQSGQSGSSNTQSPGGQGGASLGGPGYGLIGNANQGGGAGVPNSGGGGAGAGDAGTANTGAGGGGGGYVRAIINSPLATYAYSVGVGGTLGAAGTSGQTGGAGGSGRIFIIEHYN